MQCAYYFLINIWIIYFPQKDVLNNIYFCQLSYPKPTTKTPTTESLLQFNSKDWSSSMATPWIQSSLPYAGMVSAVVALAINQITSKMAMSNGTSFYILSVYSNALAALLLFPTAYLFHRYKPFPPFRFFLLYSIWAFSNSLQYLILGRSKRPPLSFPVLWRIFFLASIGLVKSVFEILFWLQFN